MVPGPQFFRRLCHPARNLLLFLLASSSALAQSPPSSENGGTPPIRVGVFTDNHPFSYVASSGKIEGYAVDLLAAVERTMGLHLERVIGPTDVITAAFHEQRLAALQSFAQTPARESQADFSVPYLTMAGSIFARKKDPAIRDFASLRGRRVMVHQGSLGEQLLRSAGLADSVVHVESVEQALRKLDAGENDATLVSRLTGLASAHYLGLKNIAPVGEPVPGYTVRYCFAVQPGDRALLARLNEGLAILQRTGEFERIYRKWFNHVDPLSGYSLLQIAFAVSAGLAIALAIAIWAIGRQRALHTRLAAQAEALRAGEERYRGLIEASQEGIVVLTPLDGDPADFIIEEANPASRRMLSFPAHPAGLRLSRALPDGKTCCARLAAAISPGGEAAYEYVYQPNLWLRVSASRIGPRILVVVSDLSEARRAEEQLRLSERQLRQTQKLEALGTLASGVAHDFNNILTSILGNADIAGLDLPPESSVHAQLAEIRAASDRARQLVRQILTYTRHAEARCETLSLTPLVEECLRFLRATVRSSISIRHQPAPGAAMIEGDPTQIHQVLMNLCTNAVQAIGDAPGAIEIIEEIVSVAPGTAADRPPQQPGDFVRLIVRDTGCGMAPEIVQRIFEPFYTTKPPGQGSGLGLSVVHGIMQNHRGSIVVDSQPGHGTSFQLYFPLTPRGSVSKTPVPTNGAPRGQGQRILFLDDEQPIGRAASQILTRLGYQVIVHHEAPAALAEFEKEPAAFALLITDLTMPRMTGLEVIRRAHALRPGLPVVLISGFVSESDFNSARALGVTQVLEKPLTIAALGRAVNESLAGS